VATLSHHAVFEIDALSRSLDIHGAAYIGSALPRALCDEARLRIDGLRPVHWDETHGGPGGTGRALDRYLCVFNRDPFWLQFIDRPGVIDLMEHVLGTDCHIIGETAWRTHPGYRAEPLHVDCVPFAGAGTASQGTRWPPAVIITVHFYLTDVGAALGPTRIVPGSHRANRAPAPGENEWAGHHAENVLARAGDALAFRSDVWHAGSDNSTTSAVRYLLQVHYGRREMAQHFSPFMAWRFDSAVLAAASRRQRRLLGDHEPGPYD
jgi:hypothetical protein